MLTASTSVYFPPILLRTWVGGSTFFRCIGTNNRYMASPAWSWYNIGPSCLVAPSAVLCVRSLLPPHLFFKLGTVCDAVAEAATDRATLQKPALTRSGVFDREQELRDPGF